MRVSVSVVRISVNIILFGALLGLMSLLVGCIGDRGPRITYHNNTDTPIWLNVRGGVPKGFSGRYELDPKISNRGPVEIGQSRSFVYFDIPLGRDLGERLGNYAITAITANVTIVYQRIFTWTELRDSNWRVVIEQSTNNP